MNNKYYGYIYLTILSFNSIEKFPNCNPFYIGQRKRKFNSRYYGSDRIINDWFESKIGQSARNTRSKLCEQLGIERYVLVYAKSKQELDKLEKFFVDPSLNTYGCININEGGNSPSNEFIENLVVRNKSLEFRNKVSKGQVEAWKNPIRKKKLSEWHNEYWSNPSNHEKHSLAGKKSHNDTQEAKDNISKGNKRWWKNHSKARFWHNPATGETFLQEVCPPKCIHGMAKRNMIYDGMVSPDMPVLFE